MLVAVDEAERAEQARFNRGLVRLLAAHPALHDVPVADTRRQREEGAGPWGPLVRSARAADRCERHAGGEVRVRTVVPDRPRGAYLHLHGGGWVTGAAHHQDAWLETVADGAGLAVASLEYALAPESPFPAAPVGAYRAARWVAERWAPELGVGAVAIGGDSAGAHLAVLALLRLRDEGGPVFAAANLAYGVFDLALTPSARRPADGAPPPSTATLGWFVEQFVPGRSGDDLRSPEVSPLYADLRDLPPALLSVGTRDPLVDDSMFMAARWQAAGSPARLAVYPELPHAFRGLPTALAVRARDAQLAFLAQVVA